MLGPIKMKLKNTALSEQCQIENVKIKERDKINIH